MRKLAFLLILLWTISSMAQVNNFSIVDGRLIWQNVFETQLDQDRIEKLIIESGQFTDIVNTGDRITFFCPRTKVNYEQFGYKWGNTPVYVSSHDIAFFCTIQFKEGRYRATLERIIGIENRTDKLYHDGDSRPLDAFAIKEGEFRDIFTRKPSEIYNKLFLMLLDFQEKTILGDDW